jgi:hypothetical protein
MLGLLACLLIAPAARGQTPPILDAHALPPIDRAGQGSYEHRFLLWPLPRAFAVGSNGRFGAHAGGRSAEMAEAAALKNCVAKGGVDCSLYASGLDVIWPSRPASRHAEPPSMLIEGGGYAVVPDPRFFWYGPQAARGIVVWGHGYNGPRTDVRGIQPPPFLRAFNNAGFDVARFDRSPLLDADVDRVSAWLLASLRDLRSRGWKTIVAGGQSRGGWNALTMLLHPGVADAIVTASAGPGTGTNPMLQASKGQTMLGQLLRDAPVQPTRVAYIQFADDPFGGDKAARAEKLNDLLRPKLPNLLLIDRPKGFGGHAAAEKAPFAEKYAACLLAFAIADHPPGGC